MQAERSKPARKHLSRDAIVEGAISVADDEGLDAVTIRRLASDNGVTPMALYWHFKDKEQLLDGIAESIFLHVETPEKSSASWDDRLQGILLAFLHALRPHPATAGLASTRILRSDAGLVLTEAVLALLREGNFTHEEGAEIASYLLSAIITLVTAEPGPEHGLDSDARAAAIRSTKAVLGSLDPDRFPHVTASADALSWCSNEDQYYARGIELLVRGTRELQTV